MSGGHEYNLGAKLLSVESIYKWKPVIYEENLNEISCEFEPCAKNEFNFNNFIIQLVKSYQAAETGDIDTALELLNELDDAGKEFNDHVDGGFFEGIQKAYYHMVYASKIFLLIKKDRHQEASVLVDKIVPIDDMDKFNRAAIYAMKTAVFALYSNEDTQKAFASIDKALKLDPDNPRWNFLKALCKRKIRKMTNPFEVPTLPEQVLFKKAHDCDPQNVVYKLHLADVYREISPHASKRQEDCSHFLPKDSSLTENLRNNIDEKIKLAVDYYKQAVADYPDHPFVMFKCAEGLARLFPNQNYIQLAKKLAEDGLKKSPDNVNGNLVMAFIYEHIEKKNPEAKKHLKKCQAKKIFDAELNMIRFLFNTKPERFDCVEGLESLLEKYQEKKRHAILYSQIVSYYIFIKLDIVKACDAAMKYFSLNCESTCMQIHRSLFLKDYKELFSLIDVLNDEVKFAMNNSSTAKEIREKCEQYIQAINFQNIKVIQGFPQNFRQQILQGKPMIINPKFTQTSKKFNHFDKGGNRRDTNGGKGDFKDRRNQPMNNHSSTSNNQPSTSNNHQNTTKRPNTNNKRPNNQQPKKPPTDSKKLPSLMSNIVDKPVEEREQTPPKPDESPAPIEKHIEPRSEESEGDPKDTKDKELAKLVLQMIKKQQENRRDSDDDSDESVTSTLQRLVFGKKNTRDKKYRSNSESDSDRGRPKDRRRDHSRRRRRSQSSSSDESDRHDRHHRRSYKRHSSSDSDGHSKSSRYRKSYKKDRHERDHSPRDRHSHRYDGVSPDKRRNGHKDSVPRSPSYDRRSRQHSSKKEKSRHRDSVCRSPSYDRRSRQHSPKKEKSKHRDSVCRSPSYDRHSRRYSSKKEKSSGRDRKNSPDRYSTRDQKHDEIDQRKSKSSRRYDRDTTSYEKKSRRRSASRETREDYRGKKESRSGKDRRGQNSSQESGSD